MKYILNKYLLFMLLIAMNSSCSAPREVSVVQQPNILFIAVDDLRPELKAYGNTIMHTPHMDGLAKQGRMFVNHYVNVPTCGASRYAMLTGRYPQTTAALANNIFERTTAGKSSAELPESLVELFRRNGYYTVSIGKISHAADGRIYGYDQPVSDRLELPNSWDEVLFNAGKWGSGWNAFFGYANGENRQSLNGQVKPYEMADVEDADYPDGLTADLAVTRIKALRESKKPFFLAVGFFKPHLPFNAPKKYWDLYKEEEIALSPVPNIPAGVDAASLHNSSEFNQYKNTDEKPSLQNPVSDAYARKLKHAYFASVSYVDAQIGKVLQALKQSGMENNTIVVLWGDHGWHLGDQRVWGKHTLSEYSLKSPLIIKSPAMPYKGRMSKAVVQSVDIYPTLMQMAGLKRPYQMDGRSLYPILQNPSLVSTQKVFAYFNNGITMRTERYRITKYYNRGDVELYDYIKDPFESQNIASENKQITDSLLLMLEEGNTGLYHKK